MKWKVWIFILLMLSGLMGFEEISFSFEGKWTKKANLLSATCCLSASEVKGKIYAIGGSPHGNVAFSTVEEYDPVKDKWTLLADLPTARSYLATAAVNGKIYAIGGTTNGAVHNDDVASVEVYNPVTNTWSKKKKMRTPKHGFSTAVIDGKIYVIGGRQFRRQVPERRGGWFSTVEVYDPATDTWTLASNMPTARGFFGTAVVRGKIYAIGGVKTGGRLTTVEIYDPQTDTWTQGADMPTARSAFAISVVSQKIYVVGGYNGISLPIVEVYDAKTDTWTQEPDMSTARDNFSAVAVGGAIYAIGGWNSIRKSVLPTVEAYDTGAGLSIEAEGKLPTLWGRIKSQ